ncbi:MAG TPA: hypothetical protein VJA47_06690 [archaeon]|nr:hypothetical protein [archaeon]
MSQSYIWAIIDILAAVLIIVTSLKSTVLVELALPVIIILVLKGGYYVVKESKFRAIIYLAEAIVLALSYTGYIIPSIAIFFAVLLFIKGIYTLVVEGLRPLQMG